MSFDRKHYREVKKHTLFMLNNPSVFIDPGSKVEWAKSFFPLLVSCVEAADYEGAHAMKDAIKEFVGLSTQPEEDFLFALPELSNLPML